MKQIVMIGTRFDALGGMASVVQVYRESGLFQRWPVRYLASHCDGNKLQKLFCMIGSWYRLLWLLCLGRVQVVHLHVATGPSLWRKSCHIGLLMLFRVPFIFHLHGAEFAGFYAQSSPWQQRWMRHLFARAWRMVVLSNSWQAWLSRICPQAKVLTLYNPVHLPQQAVQAPTGATLLLLGRLGARKGIADLLAAAQNLLPQFPGLCLILAGDGALDATKAQAIHLGMAAHVEVPGWIGGGDKQNYFARANVLVLPSYAEGLPMSVLEAMACGLPIVSTRVGGIPEAVSDGVEGLLVEAGDVAALTRCLQTLLQDPARMAQMGQAGRQKVARVFSTSVVLPQLEQIYRDAYRQKG
jgi:glycosyltransferase involved in cell wall biosynthesis